MATHKKTSKTQLAKIFVLDTSVILYDHQAIHNFEEHDIAIPIQVLEELDNHKSGNETRNFEARHFIKIIDQLSRNKLINEWTKINAHKGKFKIILSAIPQRHNAVEIFKDEKFDHYIINTALALMEEYPTRKIILVSKDICLRLKAQALDVFAEDYETGKIKNIDELYTGKMSIKDFPEEYIHALKKNETLLVKSLDVELQHTGANQFYQLKNKRKTALAFYSKQAQTVVAVHSQSVFNIKPRNPEQAFALHALLDPAIQLVSIQGNAGTGKTLLALAAALEQRKNYRQIFVTRPVISLSNKEIGFLPGDAKSKTDPYLAPIWDNLRFIKDQFLHDKTVIDKIDELIATEKIAVTPLAFIRGRTLTKIFFMVDEAQNLTPHEIKTIISRAGENTKIVFTGDIHQIDAPYLDAESNGLTYLIENVKNHPLYAHITLQKGERSELANLANNLL